ncbi:hypothetical protein Calle1_58 [Cellulophaga phage Calle_1]|uniref:Uncharacterized protein n=1 Tax=Cellulophaga phage Calle_1 TaxID=2745643 RepID=A0A8E5EB00_9CAUD|nr:hypothetical protein M1M22_gp057 [Cellulophaga phage Calle_1]QQV89757.1 hypothetical protein Calle1_58 [Cellulophaga phage Calle_1]QQV89832.1 hypothetical protein Calle2_58 [Cellulophaga phage Calle_2]QQV89887.1 hypothetical protein Calle3_58 [Cellulophaga phage Calle_3]
MKQIIKKASRLASFLARGRSGGLTSEDSKKFMESLLRDYSDALDKDPDKLTEAIGKLMAFSITMACSKNLDDRIMVLIEESQDSLESMMHRGSILRSEDNGLLRGVDYMPLNMLKVNNRISGSEVDTYIKKVFGDAKVVNCMLNSIPVTLNDDNVVKGSSGYWSQSKIGVLRAKLMTKEGTMAEVIEFKDNKDPYISILLDRELISRSESQRYLEGDLETINSLKGIRRAVKEEIYKAAYSYYNL